MSEGEQLDLEELLDGKPEGKPKKAKKSAAKPKLKAKRAAPTRAQLKLIEAAVEIGQRPPSEQEAAFIARELVQCTLPHKNPGNDKPVWSRQNGSLSLIVQQGYDNTGKPYGHPYGIIPRLLLFWMNTEALRTQNRRLELGASLASFMTELGLNPKTGGGKRGDARRLQDQMQRLFRSRISFEKNVVRAVKGKGGKIERQCGHSWLSMEVAPEGELWWDERNPDQATLWGSWIELGDKFYSAITASPVPVDICALKALKRSPLALDLYAWLTHEAYRAHKSGQARFVAWPLLMEQFGTDYSDPKDFGKYARVALGKIEPLYPGLRLGSLRGGVQIEPESFPAIRPKLKLSIGS